MNPASSRELMGWLEWWVSFQVSLISSELKEKQVFLPGWMENQASLLGMKGIQASSWVKQEYQTFW